MVEINLKSARYKEISIKTQAEGGQTLQLECPFSFNVTYVQNNTECVAWLRQQVVSANAPGALEIVVEIGGVFACKGIEQEEDKKDAHIKAYERLFPLVQNKISELVRDCGMPPLLIDMVQMDRDNIVIKK